MASELWATLPCPSLLQGSGFQPFWETALLSRRSHLDKGAAIFLTLPTPGDRERAEYPRTVSGDLLQAPGSKITDMHREGVPVLLREGPFCGRWHWTAA